MKIAVIHIPETIDGMECQTNQVHPIILLNALNLVQKNFARQILAMAEKEVGKNPKLQEQWIDRLSKKYLDGNSGDLSLDDINRMN